MQGGDRRRTQAEVGRALADPTLRSTLRRAMATLYERRASAFGPAFDFEGQRSRARAIKEQALTRNAELLAELEQHISAGGSVVADYSYVGATRVERRAYGNGTRADYQYDGVLPNPAGDFGSRKVIAITNRQFVSGLILDAHTFTWDRAENKTQRRDVRSGSLQLTNSYQYDSANRLVRSARGSQIQYPATNSYVLDGAGNRISASGGPHPGAYGMDYTTPEPADQQVNQYTSTPLTCRAAGHW